jgi:hypothetical protein
MLAQAIHALSGRRLGKFREDQLHLSDEAAFEGRIRELRAAYEVNLRAARDHPPARLLVLHAAEYRLLPYLEGALAAVDAWPFSARADLRSIFHTVTRWAWNHDPVLARILSASLMYRGTTHDWLPVTRGYERALERHRPAAAQRAEAAAELSRETIDALYWGLSVGARRGAVIRRLMSAAERLGLMPPRPRFERDESARRTTELERLMLDLELRRDPGEAMHFLLPLFRGAISDES